MMLACGCRRSFRPVHDRNTPPGRIRVNPHGETDARNDVRIVAVTPPESATLTWPSAAMRQM